LCSAQERNARQLALQVGGVALAILGMVQDGVDVVEDVPLGDGRVAVVGAELFECPVRDVLAAVSGPTVRKPRSAVGRLGRNTELTLGPADGEILQKGWSPHLAPCRIHVCRLVNGRQNPDL